MKKKIISTGLTFALLLATFNSPVQSFAAEREVATAEIQADYGDDLTLQFEGISEDYDLLESITNSGSLGIDALISREANPTLNSSNGLSRDAGHYSPETALSLSGYNIRDNITGIPQGLWYKWTPWNDENGINILNNLYTTYFVAPSNYELLLVNSDLSIIWQIPNNQEIHLAFEDLASMFGKNPNSTTTLDLYLTVQVSDGAISPTNYSLYYGATYRSGQTGYIETGLSFNFGTLNVEPPLFWNSPAYIYSGMLTNTSVPNQAMITTMRLTSDGTGTGIKNGEKFLTTASGFSTTMYGAFDIVDIPKNEHQVRQEYLIQGRLRVSDNHIWKPQLQFNYVFPVISSNLRFVPEHIV